MKHKGRFYTTLSDINGKDQKDVKMNKKPPTKD